MSTLDDVIGEGHQCALAKMCTFVHQSMEATANRLYDELRRRMYITPKSYLNLIGGYVQLLTDKRNKLTALRTRCTTGVTKIQDSNALVARLKVGYRQLAIVDVRLNINRWFVHLRVLCTEYSYV